MDRDKIWSDAIRESLKEAETTASPALWSKIESSLDSGAAAPLPRRYIWRYLSAAAVVVIAAILLWPAPEQMATLAPDQQRAQIEEQIEEQIEPAEEQLPLNSTRQEGVELLASAFATSAKEQAAEVPVEIEISTIEESEQPQIEAPEPNSGDRQKRAAQKSSSQRSEHSHSGGTLREYPRTEGGSRTDRSTQLSLLYAGGVNRSSSPASITRQELISTFMNHPNSSEEARFKSLYAGSEIDHHQPLGAGIRVEKELTERFSLSSGINYTGLTSDLYMPGDGSQSKQQLHFIGIPLQVGYKFVKAGNFSLYVAAGAAVEYCVAAKVGNIKMDERKWHYSADLSLGAEYELNPWLGLYFEPSLSHYFTQTDLRTIRNDSPTTFNMRLGVSFKF